MKKRIKNIIIYLIFNIGNILFWFWAFQQITVYR